jgi:prenylcysteine alpha-carboxyl methylesterase
VHTSRYLLSVFYSKTFVEALQRAGAQATLVLYEGKTHTDLFLQDPLRGGKDELFDHLVAVIHAGDNEALAKDAKAPPRRRLVPEFLLKLARKISPF